MKGIIYYTDNRLREPIYSIVQSQILKANLPIVSTSLKPIEFGANTVFNLVPSYPTMLRQILTALENSSADVIFFCEHDVLYHPSHFDFIPPRNDVFYYNTNVWRWHYPSNLAITYDPLTALSCLCVNRQLATDHFRYRLKKIEEFGWDENRAREPRLGRRIAYEPGTKKIRRGGLTDDDYAVWKSEYPNVDIRHGKTFTKRSASVEDFKHKPNNPSWKETTLEKIPGWNLKELFNLNI